MLGNRKIIPRSPVRFNNELSGPGSETGDGAALRGAHNKETLQSVLGLSDGEIQDLENDGALQNETVT